MVEESLDQMLGKEPLIISNRFATVYSNWGVTVILFFLLAMGIYSLIHAQWLGFIPLTIALGGLSFHYGTDIDVNNNRYREYSSILFMKFGSWKSLKLYPFITVLKYNKGRSASLGIPSMGGYGYYSAKPSDVDYTDGEFAIYLLNKSHYQKIEIELHHDLKKAQERMAYFSEAMKKEVVTYNPVRISKTR